MNKLTLLKIILFLVLAVFLSTSSLYAQISGTINADGETEPLIGVTVLKKNTTEGTTTDLDGKFSLDASPSDTLVIS